jgi:hypothetical protein
LEATPLLEDHPLALRVALVLWLLGGLLFLALAVPTLRSVVQAFDDAVYQLAIELEFSPAVWVAEGLGRRFLGPPLVHRTS